MAFRKITFLSFYNKIYFQQRPPPRWVCSGGCVTGAGLFVQGPHGRGVPGTESQKWITNCKRVRRSSLQHDFINMSLNPGGFCNLSEPFSKVPISSKAAHFQNAVSKGPRDMTCLQVALPDAPGTGVTLVGCEEERMPR